MHRLIARTRPRITHFRLWILYFWCFLLLLESTANAPDTPGRRTNPEMQTKTQDWPQLSTSTRTKETQDPEARRANLYAHTRLLKQQASGSTSEEQRSCSLSATRVSAFYDESNRTWTVTNALLNEVDNDLQQIVNCAFENDIIYFRTNGTIQPSTTISIAFPLTLRGASGTTLTCPLQGALLIARTSTFRMDNLVISGCNGTSNILVLNPNCTTRRTGDTCVLNNMSFERNALFEDAHIIKATSLCSELEIVGVAFLSNRCFGTHCVALGSRNTLTNVHLVSNHGSNETFLDSIFFGSIGSESNVTEVISLNNTIRSFYVSNGKFRMKDSHFEGNEKNHSSGTRDNSIGGGVLFSDHSSISLSNTTLERNCALNGGALFAWTSNVSINDCMFHENDAREGNGGALYGHHNSSFNITSSVLSKNSGYHGAGVYSNHTLNVNIMNTRVLENNSSRSSTVSIHNGMVNVKSSEFLQNIALEWGGALGVTSVKLSLKNSTFIRNDANFGGACAFQENSTVRASTLLFENNRVQLQGGGVFLKTGIHLRIRDSVFQNNSAIFAGGAIYSRGECETYLRRVKFSNNTSAEYGGALEISEGNFTGANLTFVRNRAAREGGAISFYEANDVTISKSFFEGNTARNGGATLFLATLSGHVDQCTFLRNSVHEGEGGAIRAETSNVTILKSEFHANVANLGGSLDFSNECNSSIVDSSFESNVAQTGGAIHIHSTCSLILLNSSFSRNNAGESGGGVYAIGASHINASNVNVIQNIAGTVGGGIALINASSFLCHSCLVLNNKAFSGAGLHAFSNNSIPIVAQFQSSRFENNSAESYGGGIEFVEPQERDINCSYPQVICGRVILLNTSFVDNHANSGAVILTSDPNNVLVDCEDNKGRDNKFLTETTVNSLEAINPQQLCLSWVRNNVSSNAYGYAVGTYGQMIALAIDPRAEVKLVGNTTSGYVLENVSSGRQLPTINVTILDRYGQGPSPTLPYTFEARLSSSDGFFRGLHVIDITGGSGNFSEVAGFARSGNYTLNITSDNPSIETLLVDVVVRACQVGEEPTRDGLACQQCDAFSYNFNISEVGGCKECPDDAICEGRFIVPKEGSWHTGPCHDDVKGCLVKEACKYQNRKEVLIDFTQNFTTCDMTHTTLEAYRDDLCNEGYEGPICGSCKTNFGLSFLTQCLKCPHKAISFLVIAGVTMYLLVVASFTIRGCIPFDIKKAQIKSRRFVLNKSREVSLKDPEVNVEMVKMMIEGYVPPEYFHRNQAEASTSRTPIASTHEETDYDLSKWKMTELFKIMINFLQTTAVAATLDLDWSDGMNGLFEASEYIGALSTSLVSRPSDCLASSATKVTRFVWRMLLSVFVPTFVILTIATFWAFMALKNGEDISYFGKRSLLSAIAVIYISYLGLTKMGVRAFYCVGVSDSINFFSNSKNQYLASDTSIKCYEKEHLSIIAIGVIVLAIVTVAFPLVSGVVLLKNKQRHMRKDGWMFEIAGFLFRAFKESCLFWESLVMLRKACLSIIVVFSYSLGGLPQGILALLVLLTSLYIHLLVKPYRKEFKKLNTLESVSLLVSCMTFTLGLFFSKNMSSNYVRIFLSIVIIITNSLFFIFLLSALIKSGIGHIRVVLQYENDARYDQVPWWRLLKTFTIVKCRSLLKLSS